MSLHISVIKTCLREEFFETRDGFFKFVSECCRLLDADVKFEIPGIDRTYSTIISDKHNIKCAKIAGSEYERIFREYKATEVDLSKYCKLKFAPIVHVSTHSAQRPELVDDITTLFALYTERFIERRRYRIRQEIIRCKIETKDLGSFLYKTKEAIVNKIFDCEGLSVFVFSETTRELKLRATTGLINDLAYIDNVFSLDCKSYIVSTFSNRESITEFCRDKALHSGRTAEQTNQPIRSRGYFPIQTRVEGSKTRKTRHERPTCVGTLRIVNPKDIHGNIRPLNVIDEIFFEYLCEVIFVNIESFVDGEVAGFDRDLAFHAAASVVDGILKNLEMAQSLLFGASDTSMYREVKSQFKITPNGLFSESELKRCFENSYAFAVDIGSQIERANLVTQSDKSSEKKFITKHLLADVIQKAVNLIPAMKTSHSCSKQLHSINRIFDLPFPPPVYGKTGDLLSVFKNIFENSIKYNQPDNPIKIDVDLKESKGFVEIEIRDYGIGVKEADLDRLFTPGFRSKIARDHRVKGSGLGLAYCRRLINSFNGDMWVERRDPGISVFIRLRCVESSAKFV